KFCGQPKSQPPRYQYLDWSEYGCTLLAHSSNRTQNSSPALCIDACGYVGGARLSRLGAPAHPGLRRLLRRGDQMREKDGGLPRTGDTDRACARWGGRNERPAGGRCARPSHELGFMDCRRTPCASRYLAAPSPTIENGPQKPG